MVSAGCRSPLIGIQIVRGFVPMPPLAVAGGTWQTLTLACLTVHERRGGSWNLGQLFGVQFPVVVVDHNYTEICEEL